MTPHAAFVLWVLHMGPGKWQSGAGQPWVVQLQGPAKEAAQDSRLLLKLIKRWSKPQVPAYYRSPHGWPTRDYGHEGGSFKILATKQPDFMPFDSVLGQCCQMAPNAV
jgi:hypothetical protein